jgi:hypothetical protein
VLGNCTKEGGWKQAESNEELNHLYCFAKSHPVDQSKVGIIGGAWRMHGRFWLLKLMERDHVKPRPRQNNNIKMYLKI